MVAGVMRPRSIARRSRCASCFLVWAPLCSVWGAFCVVWVCVCPHTRAYGGGCFCGPSCPVGGRSLGSHVLLLLHPRKSRCWCDVPACSRARLKPLNTVTFFPSGKLPSASLPASASASLSPPLGCSAPGRVDAGAMSLHVVGQGSSRSTRLQYQYFFPSGKLHDQHPCQHKHQHQHHYHHS